MKTHINGNTIEQIMTNAVTLTQAQYDLLPLEQKNHGTYIISDSTCPNISANNVDYDTNTTVKQKLDEINSIEVITASAVSGVTNNSIVYKLSDNVLIISVDVTFSSVTTMWNDAFTVNIPGKQCTGVFGAANNNGLIQAYGTSILTVRLNNVTANTLYRGQVVVPLLDL